MAIIDTEHWGHDFFVNDGRFYLCVPCGTVAVYEVTVELTADEFEAYERDGLKILQAQRAFAMDHGGGRSLTGVGAEGYFA